MVGVKRKYGKEAQTIKREEELQKRRERLNKEYQLFSFGEHRTIQKNADSHLREMAKGVKSIDCCSLYPPTLGSIQSVTQVSGDLTSLGTRHAHSVHIHSHAHT